MTSWIQTADWKSEKHVPVISIKKFEDGVATVVVKVGAEIAHPNTTNHHIKWIDLFFWPEGGKFPVEIVKVLKDQIQVVSTLNQSLSSSSRLRNQVN